ncbi:MAG: hypothetical protein CMA86_06635 [Euryarchaeota archaeon]|nr:hypothetical protein [Euryarchaeota archaeon]
MVVIEHGDLLEQRRGGVDVLRVLVRTLALHEQSGAVLLRRSKQGEAPVEGWLLFRLGHPVMAFSSSGLKGLEALLAIEADALDVNNDVELYELSMAALRSTMAEHPDSVLHLEHQTSEHRGDAWWSSVRLPSTSWRRADRLEDIDELALPSEHRRREGQPQHEQEVLHPGGVYLFDSPDPHPMIHLAVELAERGMPLLGLFGLPHASTDITQRLPSPQCYALLSPHGAYQLLQTREEILATVNAFQWGNERSVILLDGLDRLGNAFGDDAMLDIYRSIGDGVRFNDHVLICTTDLEMYDTRVRHGLLSECLPLRVSTVEGWLDDADGLWDHPVLLAPDEEEEQWLEAQIRHQGAKVGGPAYIGDAGLVGGSIEVDETTRQEATKALNDVVSEWPSAQATPPALPQEETAPTSIGATAWRPVDETPVLEGRYVSESPHLSRVVEVPDVKPQKMPKKRLLRPAQPKRPPQLRKAQRLQARKPAPVLPVIDQGLASQKSSAIVTAAPDLPEWPAKRATKDAYRKENMDGYTRRQDQALERQSAIPRPVQTSALRDNVASSPDLTSSALPEPRVPKTVDLPADSEAAPLTNSLRPVEDIVREQAREAASMPQHATDLDEMYEKWTTFEEVDGLDATALYNEKGEALERYKGGSS